MKQITDKNEFDKIINGERPVLADFYADWCGPCGMIAPIISEIAEEHGEIEVVKINVDAAVEIAAEYRVMSIPTVVLFRKGAEVSRMVGASDKSEYEDMLLK